MSIPIRNLYYIFSYAWSHFPRGELDDVGYDELPDILNLFAKLVIDGAHRIIRQGLARDYVANIDDLRAPRGRLLLSEISKRQTLSRGRVTCQFDEFQADTLPNQIIKATSRILERADTVAPQYKHELGTLFRRLANVSDIRLSNTAFRTVQVPQSNQTYDLLLRISHFIFRAMLPDETRECAKFSSILDDEATMSSVFEDFLRNFFAHEQSNYTVKRDILRWNAECLSAEGERYLPIMETDISLRNEAKTMIVEAKYYQNTLKSRRGGKERFHSPNLYQVFTYLHHVKSLEPGRTVDGLIIYPSVGNSLEELYRIDGSLLKIVTVDFDQRWPDVHTSLLNTLRFTKSPDNLMPQVT